MEELKCLVRLIFMPQKGWEVINESKQKGDDLNTSLLYPLSGIYSVVIFLLTINFTELRADSNIEQAIQYATIGFVQFFASNHLIAYLSKKFFTKHNPTKLNIYITYLISVVILYYTVNELFSNYSEYLIVFALYIIYIAWSGYRYVNYENGKTNTIFVFAISSMLLLFPAIMAILLKSILLILQ